LLALVYLPTGQKLVKTGNLLFTYSPTSSYLLPTFLPTQRALQQFKLRIRIISRFLSSSFRPLLAELSSLRNLQFRKNCAMDSPISWALSLLAASLSNGFFFLFVKSRAMMQYFDESVCVPVGMLYWGLCFVDVLWGDRRERKRESCVVCKPWNFMFFGISGCWLIFQPWVEMMTMGMSWLPIMGREVVVVLLGWRGRRQRWGGRGGRWTWAGTLHRRKRMCLSLTATLVSRCSGAHCLWGTHGCLYKTSLLPSSARWMWVPFGSFFLVCLLAWSHLGSDVLLDVKKSSLVAIVILVIVL